ncbi:MAG: PAS domain S-box protein, partial [Sphingobacteriia bacterium]|nr:PAS domain S-box protein [Sphingobacteriia bacterium]
MTNDPCPAANSSRAIRDWLEHLPVGTYELRIQPDGRPEFTHVSSRWLAMCGLDRARFMADQGLALEVIHPEDRQSMLTANLDALASMRPFYWEGRLMVNGEVVWMAISSNPLATADGETLWEGVMIDVSAHKRLESQLRACLAQLSGLLEHLPTAVLITALTPDQPVLFCNLAFIRVFGYSQEELPTLASLAHLVYPDPDERAAIWSWWDAALATAKAGHGHIESKTLRITVKDASTRDVVMSASLVDDLLIAAFEDITETKRAEAELIDARRMLDTVLGNVDAYIYVKGPDRRYRYINPKVAELYQKPVDEILGKTDAELFSQERALSFHELDDQVLLYSQRFAGQEVMVDARGKTHHFWSVKLPLRWSDDKMCLIGFSTEISELLDVQAAMARSETRFRALFEATSEAVMLLDTRHFIDCNQATLRLFGIPDQEAFRAAHPGDLSPSVQPCGIASLELAGRHIQAALREGSRRFEWVHRRSDTGVDIPCEVVLSAIDLDGERVLLGTVRDQSERWRAAAELREAMARLDT